MEEVEIKIFNTKHRLILDKQEREKGCEQYCSLARYCRSLWEEGHVSICGMFISPSEASDAYFQAENPERDPYEVYADEDCRVKAPHFFIDEEGNLVWEKYENHFYCIDRERLAESDWMTHMFCKMDYNLFGEFVAAYLTACRRNGLKNITIDTMEMVDVFAQVKNWH